MTRAGDSAHLSGSERKNQRNSLGRDPPRAPHPAQLEAALGTAVNDCPRSPHLPLPISRLRMSPGGGDTAQEGREEIKGRESELERTL